MTTANAGSRVVRVPCSSQGSFPVANSSGTLCGAVFSPQAFVTCSDNEGQVIYGGALNQAVYNLLITPSIPSQGIDFVGGLNCNQYYVVGTCGQSTSLLYIRSGLLC